MTEKYRWRNQDIVHGIHFGLFVDWLTDFTVQTAFSEMGARHPAAPYFLERDNFACRIWVSAESAFMFTRNG